MTATDGQQLDTPPDMREALRQLAGGWGATVFGVADVGWLRLQVPDLLEEIPGDFTRAVVMGMRLQDAVVDGIVDHPTPLYFHNYRQLNYQLDRAAFAVADCIQAGGATCIAVPASQIIRNNPMRGHISHKLLGWAAGIGFVGRSTLLVHPTFGSRLRYVSVLTNRALPADKPHAGSCGECRACIPVCPAHAIGETKEDFNLDACYRKLSEFSRIPFVGQHICGVCVKACNGNRTGGST
jgi:epoxyqueuosine reductase